MPSRIAVDASALYARNLLAFLTPLVDKETKALKIDWDDEIVKAHRADPRRHRSCIPALQPGPRSRARWTRHELPERG